MRNESRDLAASNVCSGNCRDGVVFPVPERLRKNIRIITVRGGRITDDADATSCRAEFPLIAAPQIYRRASVIVTAS